MSDDMTKLDISRISSFSCADSAEDDAEPGRYTGVI